MNKVFSDLNSILNGDDDPGGFVTILKNRASDFEMFSFYSLSTSPSSVNSLDSIILGKAFALVQWSSTLIE